jgi:hypothetical protein
MISDMFVTIGAWEAGNVAEPAQCVVARRVAQRTPFGTAR